MIQISDTHSVAFANAVIESAGTLVLVLDREGRFVRFNRACETLSGYTFDEVVGRCPWETVLPPVDAATIRREAFDALASNPATGSGHYTNAWVSRNGDRHLIEWFNTLLLDANGNMEFMVCVGMDVTVREAAVEALRLSEHKLQELASTLETRVWEQTAKIQEQNLRNEVILRTTPDGFFAADTTGRIRVANPAFCEMLGYAEDELLRMSIPEIEANENPRDVAAHIEKVLATGYDRFDTRHRRKDGTLVSIEISVTLVDIAGEKLIYAFSRDISWRKEAEATLVRAREEAERANRAKSEFLSRMSHELRTPMNAILGFAQVLEAEGLPPEQEDYVQEIHRAGDHLLELINELLDLSRIETGRLSIVVQAVDLKAVLSQAVHIVQPMMAMRQIALLDECTAPVRVLADPTRLRQVLVNLLSNATKYNREGGRIMLNCQPVGENTWRLGVSDTGEGIAPEKLDQLFKPFERLGAEFTAVEGSGIGLALSKQIAELMGASLGVESTLGRGTTFWIDLPLAGTERGTDTKVGAGDTAADAGAGAGAMRVSTVLYVEDNPANLRVVEAMFRRHAHLRLLTANQGEYGLELARRFRPDAVLLDIHLPGLDGYAVLKELQADPTTRDIPVIALSADAMPLDVETELKAGFRAYLTKPVKLPELMAALDTVFAAPAS